MKDKKLKFKTEDVFGVRKDLVESYIERPKVDGVFLKAKDQDRHIVIYGASKQGKTALIQKHIEEEDMIKISCSPKMGTSEIYKSIVRGLGIQLKESTQREKGANGEVTLKTSFQAMIPFVGGTKAEIAATKGNTLKELITHREIPVNFEIAQDIIYLLNEVKIQKYIVLENFHYLDNDTQSDLAFDLRAFQEQGVRFIILGIWKEKNKLNQFNGDLVDRIIDVPVEPWEEADFIAVIDKGSNLLNIKIDEKLRSEIINKSFRNIGIVQELCKELCLQYDIIEKSSNMNILDDISKLYNSIEIKAESYSSRHLRTLESIAAHGSSRDKGLYLPYYLVRVIVEADLTELLSGITKTALQEKIKAIHYRGDDVRISDMTNLLQKLSEVQSKKKIIPPIFDYDTLTSRLRIIDSTLLFFLNSKSKGDILSEIPNPTNEK